jgi:site-specific DNA recombinase
LKIAHRWYALLASARYPSISALARSERVDPSEVSRTITLAFLAPAIVRLILRGTQPASLTLDRLRRARPLPADWNEQHRHLIG